MYDKYNTPGSAADAELYEESPIDKAKNILGPIIEKAKENKKIIIAVLLIAILGFFAYDFLIGSVKQVSFSVKDSEGNPINASIKIFSEKGEELQRTTANQQIQLKTGNYKIDIIAPEFKSIRAREIQITANEQKLIVLEKDLDFEISGTLPEIFFTGQETAITLTIKNNETTEEQANLVLEGDAEKTMEIEYSKPIALIPGDNQIEATIKVDKDAEGKDTGENKTIAIRIEGLTNKKAKIEAKYSLIKFDERKLTVKFGTSDKADFREQDAGKTVSNTIKVENKNDFEINDIQIEVEITSTEFSDKEEVKKWFEFSPSNILNVSKQNTGTITIILKIPETMEFPQGKETETIKGVIYVRTSFYEKQLPLDLKVNKQKTGITIAGIQATYNPREKDGEYPIETGYIEIKNTGEVLLENFQVLVECNSKNESWLKIGAGQTETEFDSLVKKTSKKIPFVITVPTGTPKNTIVYCKIGAIYFEPNNTMQQQELQVQIVTQ